MGTAEIAWQEGDTVEALFARYRSEGNPKLLPRWQALWLLRRGMHRSQVADVIGIDPRTLREWVSWYRQGGCLAVASHRQGREGGSPPRLSMSQRDQVRDRAAQGAFRGIAAVREWVSHEFGVDYTYWGMRSILDRMQIHLKVPRPLAVKGSLAAQEAWQKGGCGKR